MGGGSRCGDRIPAAKVEPSIPSFGGGGGARCAVRFGPMEDALRAMSDAVLAIAAERRVDPVLQRLVDAARSLAGARYAAVGIPDGEGGFATFITALGIGCLSHVFARTTRAPAQCFLIPGVMFLVPGTYIYRAFSAALDRKLEEAATLSLATVTITVGISFGLLLANWLVPAKKTL